VTHDRPGVLLLGAGLRLAVFWGVGPLLVMRTGSVGACLAVLLAQITQAAYLGWTMRAQMAPALRSWGACVLAGALFLPLVWLRSSIPLNVALFVASLAGFLGLLLVTRVLAVSQVVETWRAIGQAGRGPRAQAVQGFEGAPGSRR
jgi:hypothetical protein